MRMLLNVKIPHAEFNQAVRDGRVGRKVSRIFPFLQVKIPLVLGANIKEKKGERKCTKNS
jgi:hypothetical protein